MSGEQSATNPVPTPPSVKRRRLDAELGFSSPGPAFQSAPSRRRARSTGKKPEYEDEASPSPPPQHEPPDALSSVREEHAQRLREDLRRTHDEHDALVCELFHLSKFVTLVGYDPVAAKNDKSEVFAQFQLHYDLASRLAADTSSPGAGASRTRRAAARRIEQLEGEPSKTQQTSPSPRPTIRLKRTQPRPPPPPPPENIALVPLSSASPDPANPPPMHFTAPTQLPAQALHGSLRQYYDSYAMWGDEAVTRQVYDQRVARDTGIYLRLDQLRREGRVLEPKETHAPSALRPSDPPRQKSHHDHLLEAVVAHAQRARLIARHHVQLAKKVSRMVAAHWERTLHSDEREQKLEERRMRALAKWTVREVQRQWKLAVTVIRAQKQSAAQAERDKLGKKQLQAIIEQSTQILETQHQDLQAPESDQGESELDDEDQDSESEIASEDEADCDEESDEEHSSPDDAADDAADDDAASQTSEQLERSMWDQDEEDEDEDADLLADAELPIEELMSKYNYQPHAEDAPEQEAEQEAEPEHTDADLERLMWEEDEEDEDEDADLLAEADMPIEELKRKYGVQASENSDAEQDGADAQIQEVDAKTESDGSDGDETRDLDENTASDGGDGDETRDLDEKAASDGGEADKDVSLRDLFEGAPETEGKIRTPFLFRGTLRPYQQKGLEWLVSLYNNKVNGILADEMGLGKTIQTIALLAHLACDRGVWGPHLVIAPTSVMLNWEMEFKKFLPGFKVLSYFGSQKERREKRKGWNTENSFHVCITSYQLVLADQHIFRRKPWTYLILDEAHNIKNFRSQRWQTLLGFNSQHRLLLTGTPLQNNLMDLWSLMYFLMPQGLGAVAEASGAFSSMKDFQDWFSNPLGKAVESGSNMDEETMATVAKLHTVLRPYVLRRLKSDVEREMPHKYEHVMRCRLSKRQRFLYNDFMARAKTRESLASGNYLSIINCLMQLRKVCNHPDLFESRPIVTPFVHSRGVVADYEIKSLLVRRRLLEEDPFERVSLDALGLRFTQHEPHLTPLVTTRYRTLDATRHLVSPPPPAPPPVEGHTTAESLAAALSARRAAALYSADIQRAYLNRLRCTVEPIYGRGLFERVSIEAGQPCRPLSSYTNERTYWTRCDALNKMVMSYEDRAQHMSDAIERFAFATPPAIVPDLPPHTVPGFSAVAEDAAARPNPLHKSAVAQSISFPDASLLQYDCGKLQQLDILMRKLYAGGHRVLVFTQMTKVLDILEKFFNYHGYRYLRLDGATRVEQRQALTERFNRDPRITAFILSTRSGGLGINLIGADTVVFYDLDWNAAIESQCMDRAHRIGQTRDVHIYRFVSEHTIEENMLRKANQKRLLDNVVIQQGEFTTDHLLRNDWRDMLDEDGTSLGGVRLGSSADAERPHDVEKALYAAEDAEDAAAARIAHQEMALDAADFAAENTPTSHEHEHAPAPAPAPENEAAQTQPPSDDESEDLTGSVDDYMLRIVASDWEFFGP
ncbi:DNA helicase [Malassezia cuniculi]|uniref:DNA helicase n=1 Tax=Malassezia cuniculi TaxID=948313 RepID=A0AAF0EQU9_9BASI|nr:DNA helicase [Malassezia cuniculi]